VAEKESDGNAHPKLWDLVGYFAFRVTDSGLAPWTLVALFLLGGGWILTRHLDSKDSLSLITRIGSLHGFAWSGWVFAFIEIPIAKWLINRARQLNKDKIARLEQENKKARELLKKHKLGEFGLEG
jgi:hypothetical protein